MHIKAKLRSENLYAKSTCVTHNILTGGMQQAAMMYSYAFIHYLNVFFLTQNPGLPCNGYVVLINGADRL